MISHLRDRKTATMFLIIVALVVTNLATLWRLQSQPTPGVASQAVGTTAPASASSSGQEYLPIDFQCQPVVTPDGVITLYGTMGNPNAKDLTNAKFCLTNVQNATWLDSDLVPTQNANGVYEWDLGILPAQRQFNVAIRLQASGKDAVAAVVTGKSDLSATYLAPIAVAIPSDKR